MKINFLILFSFLCLNSEAQKTCLKYDEAMKKGYEFLNKKNYEKALPEFQAAQIAARECGISPDKPADELKKVFEGFKFQRDEAVKQKNAAIRANLLARAETKRANENAASAKLAQEKTEKPKIECNK